MLTRWRQTVLGLLPAVAVMVLLAGPAAAVVHRECSVRLARQQKARQQAAAGTAPKPSGKPKAVPPGVAAFVAAEAAKPPSNGFPHPSPALRIGEPTAPLRFRLTGELAVQSCPCPKSLHHPAYQALAPPTA